MVYSFSVWMAPDQAEYSGTINRRTLGDPFSSLQNKKGTGIYDTSCGSFAPGNSLKDLCQTLGRCTAAVQFQDEMDILRPSVGAVIWYGLGQVLSQILRLVEQKIL